MDIGTSYGLALSSGINAYLPLLSFAIAVRWLHLYTVQPPFEYVTSDWFMIVLAILALADLFADKIPGVDHVWDVIHTVLRPLAGALVAAVSQHQVSGAGLVVPVVLGAGLAGLAHVTKASVRVTSTATSVGFLNPIISVLEDIGMLIGTALSLFAPIVMVIVIVLFVLFFLLTVPRLLKRWRNRRMKRAVAGS